jgi:hypothetical protein
MEPAVRIHWLTLIVFFAMISASIATTAQALENVQGKTYSPTRRHGPWMIMVASFSNVRDGSNQKDGLTAEQAAAQLIFDLREKGIPAYSYAQGTERAAIKTRNRQGHEEQRIYVAQREMICVLAGNYKTVDEDIGQQTLKFVKQLQPRFLRDATSGAILRVDSAKRGPLSGAFMTINPMINPKELAEESEESIDQEIAALNKNIAYPLIKNPHPYTLQVATFGGKSAVALDNDKLGDRERLFDSKLAGDTGFGLDTAGEHAQQLAAFVRAKKHIQGGPNSGVNDAYVYHDKFQSIVTIGGFDSPDDPRISAITKYYEAQMVTNRDAHRAALIRSNWSLSDEDAEKLPKELQPHTEQIWGTASSIGAECIWVFDATPKLIRVPRSNQ